MGTRSNSWMEKFCHGQRMLHLRKCQTIGERQGYLYKLYSETKQALIYETHDSNDIWHRRLGHIHFCGLPSMEKLVTGLRKLNSTHNGTYKGCALEKNTKGSFQNNLSRTSNELELIHLDLCGSMSTPSWEFFFTM